MRESDKVKFQEADYDGAEESKGKIIQYDAREVINYVHS